MADIPINTTAEKIENAANNFDDLATEVNNKLDITNRVGQVSPSSKNVPNNNAVIEYVEQERLLREYNPSTLSAMKEMELAFFQGVLILKKNESVLQFLQSASIDQKINTHNGDTNAHSTLLANYIKITKGVSAPPATSEVNMANQVFFNNSSSGYGIYFCVSSSINPADELFHNTWKKIKFEE